MLQCPPPFLLELNQKEAKAYAVDHLSGGSIALDRDVLFFIGEKFALLLLWFLLAGYIIARSMQSKFTKKIREEKIAKDRLELSNRDLKSRVKEQGYFIKKMLHEIGTPVSIIILNVDLLYKKIGESSHLNIIKASSKVLSTIYDDISYIISKRSNSFEAQRVDLDKFVRDRVSYFYEALKVKSITCEVNSCKSPIVYMNKIELQRLLDNTISNAIKYSHEHAKIVIDLQNRSGIISLSVEDFGIGIKDVDKIFTNFYRDKHQQIGLGIGLSIVKDICNSNDIDIEVSSVLNRGTTFTYTFNRLVKQLKDSGEDR